MRSLGRTPIGPRLRGPASDSGRTRIARRVTCIPPRVNSGRAAQTIDGLIPGHLLRLRQSVQFRPNLRQFRSQRIGPRLRSLALVVQDAADSLGQCLVLEHPDEFPDPGRAPPIRNEAPPARQPVASIFHCGGSVSVVLIVMETGGVRRDPRACFGRLAEGTAMGVSLAVAAFNPCDLGWEAPAPGAAAAAPRRRRSPESPRYPPAETGGGMSCRSAADRGRQRCASGRGSGRAVLAAHRRPDPPRGSDPAPDPAPERPGRLTGTGRLRDGDPAPIRAPPTRHRDRVDPRPAAGRPVPADLRPCPNQRSPDPTGPATRRRSQVRRSERQDVPGPVQAELDLDEFLAVNSGVADVPHPAGGAVRKLRRPADPDPNDLALGEFSAHTLDINRCRGGGTTARWHGTDPATGRRQCC